jgi:O-antigen ligase
LSPHITFLANLAETGIIGFVGFLIFLGSSLWMGIKSVNLAFSEEQIFYSIIILALQFYILFSMFLTDAWLWGQCGMLWGVVLGLSIANYKIITQKNKSQLNVAK